MRYFKLNEKLNLKTTTPIRKINSEKILLRKKNSTLVPFTTEINDLGNFSKHFSMCELVIYRPNNSGVFSKEYKLLICSNFIVKFYSIIINKLIALGKLNEKVKFSF